MDDVGRKVTVRSAGAEQVVALSLIDGLNRTGRSVGPVIMDTPFGRLDLKHRDNILSYLPEVTSQFVLLVHSGEIRPDTDLSSVKPRIGFAYQIVEVSPTRSKIERVSLCRRNAHARSIERHDALTPIEPSAYCMSAFLVRLRENSSRFLKSAKDACLSQPQLSLRSLKATRRQRALLVTSAICRFIWEFAAGGTRYLKMRVRKRNGGLSQVAVGARRRLARVPAPALSVPPSGQRDDQTFVARQCRLCVSAEITADQEGAIGQVGHCATFV